MDVEVQKKASLKITDRGPCPSQYKFPLEIIVQLGHIYWILNKV